MRLFIVAVIALLLYGLQPAAAQSPTHTTTGNVTSQDVVTGIINEIERRTIGRYYQGDDYDDSRQGHGKKKSKKGKNKDLPPGLAKRDLPSDLEFALPRRIGERFYIVDGNVVLVEQATGVVLDIIDNIVRAGRQGN